jgi:hypothetical protein
MARSVKREVRGVKRKRKKSFLDKIKKEPLTGFTGFTGLRKKRTLDRLTRLSGLIKTHVVSFPFFFSYNPVNLVNPVKKSN